jgi:hypothetical protein
MLPRILGVASLEVSLYTRFTFSLSETYVEPADVHSFCNFCLWPSPANSKPTRVVVHGGNRHR